MYKPGSYYINNINNHFKCEWPNISIKKQRLAEWIKKNRLTICFL